MKRANRVLQSFAAAAFLSLSTTVADAEQACAPRDKAVTELEKRFDERVFGRGLATNGKRMLELFVSETGSWTVLVSDPNGHSCVMASGENWHGIKRLVGDPA